MTSWRDKLRKASFRGAGFLVAAAGGEVGRRTAVHTYPLRDLPYTEDLGRKARSFDLEAYVLGADYMAARDALLAACEEAGPGKLIHPYLGEMEVTCQGCRESESPAHGGQAIFSLSFQEAGKRNYPAKKTDFKVQAAGDAQNARQVAGDVFAQVYRVTGPAWLALNAAGEVKAALNLVTAVASAIPSPFDALGVSKFLAEVQATIATVDSVITSGVNTAAALQGALERLTDLSPINQAAAVLNAALEVTKYGEPKSSEEASPYGGALVPVPTKTATRVIEALNQNAIKDLVRRLAVSVGVDAALNATYDSFQSAMKARDQLLGKLDELIIQAGDQGEDEAYQAFRTLYTSSSQAFRQMGASLEHLNEVPVPPAATPALVLSYDLYQDLGREAEIISRNSIRHPGLLPGGETLQVLGA